MGDVAGQAARSAGAELHLLLRRRKPCVFPPELSGELTWQGACCLSTQLTVMSNSCPHCNNPTPAGASAAPYCCQGCRLAHQFLLDAGLDRFYALREGTALPAVGDSAAAVGPLAWLEPLLEQAVEQDGIRRLILDVQGIKCAACVWLLERLYSRLPGAVEIRVNSGVGRLELLFRREFEVRAYLEDLARFGYRTGPPCKQSDGALDDLWVRFGVCAAIAMNSMIFSFALYFGLSAASEPGLYRIFSWANWLLSIAAVAVGGSIFIKSAAQALRRGILHMDVPIALGVILAFAGSTWSFFGGDGQASYFDTLNVFIALMLLGRLLQRRVASANRRVLLADDGVDGLWVRRVDAAQRLAVVQVAALRTGDTLLLLPGELLPVRAVLLDGEAAFSLKWISGEAEPGLFGQGQPVPAGAHNAESRALRLRAAEPFAASALGALLGAPQAARQSGERRDFWHQLSRFYVLGVLTLSTLALLLWWHAGALRALSVVVSVLVVTCPCALGLATPLAFELTQAQLRRRGLFIRQPSFLDRALRVRHVVFDKTGTLTLGELVLAAPGQVHALPLPLRAALYQMVVRSNHPKSRALFAAFQGADSAAALDPDALVREEPGHGLSARIGDKEYRLGSAAFALGTELSSSADEVVFACAGELVARFALREELRHDAAHEIAALQRDGLAVSLLSGDAVARVQRLAQQLGLPPAAAHGAKSPTDKAAFIKAVDNKDTLMIGDGVNDALAMSAAYCAGTPAADRPTLPERADFYFLGRGVGPIRETLQLARRTRAVIVRNLTFSLVYNLAVLALCFSGQMTPLRCALVMPLSSLLVVLATVHAFREPRPAAPALAPALAVSP